jgi:hypothetical protein
MARRGAGKVSVSTHFWIVAQAASGALRLCDPGQPVTINDGKSHELAGSGCHTIEQWLGNIHNPCRLKIAETHCYKLSGEHVVTVIPALADIAAAAQVCQQPVRGAAGNV